MNTITNYLKSVKEELKNVSWPTKKMTFSHTILVIAISIILALVLFYVDKIFHFILNIFL